MLVLLFTLQWIEGWLDFIPTNTSSRFGIDFEYFFPWILVRIQHARIIVHLWVSEIWLSNTPADTSSGVGIHFESFLPSLWVRIQYARSLVHLWVNEVWLGYIPCLYWQWIWNRFWNYFFHECGWGSSMLVPFVTCEWLSFGLIISLLRTNNGIGIHFEYCFFHKCGWGSSMLVPLLISQWLIISSIIAILIGLFLTPCSLQVCPLCWIL